MFDENEEPTWSDEEFPNPADPAVMSMEQLRDTALKLFDSFLARQNGVKPEDYEPPDAEVLETQRGFLSLKEAEAIVQSHSQHENKELFAIGGEDFKAAVKKINDLMMALVQRIMSNVVAEGVRRDLIDVSYDNDVNDFAFRVNQNGHDLLKSHYGDYEDEENVDE